MYTDADKDTTVEINWQALLIYIYLRGAHMSVRVCTHISIYRRFDEEGVTVDKEGLEKEGKEDLRRITPTGSLQSLKKSDIPPLSRT